MAGCGNRIPPAASAVVRLDPTLRLLPHSAMTDPTGDSPPYCGHRPFADMSRSGQAANRALRRTFSRITNAPDRPRSSRRRRCRGGRRRRAAGCRSPPSTACAAAATVGAGVCGRAAERAGEAVFASSFLLVGSWCCAPDPGVAVVAGAAALGQLSDARLPSRASVCSIPMPAGSADRNRSPIVSVTTPRGRIDVMHQEMRGLGSRSGWHKFWLARRTGTRDWVEATTPREAIRRAVLLPAKKTPGWLDAAVREAERQLERPGCARSAARSGLRAPSALLRTELFRL